MPPDPRRAGGSGGGLVARRISGCSRVRSLATASNGKLFGNGAGSPLCSLSWPLHLCRRPAASWDAAARLFMTELFVVLAAHLMAASTSASGGAESLPDAVAALDRAGWGVGHFGEVAQCSWQTGHKRDTKANERRLSA